MTGSVQDVYLVGFVHGCSLWSILEFHHRGCDRDTALLLDFHPVGGGGLLYLVALYGSGHLYLATEEQEFFCQCGFAGIGVGDDGKGASA